MLPDCNRSTYIVFKMRESMFYARWSYYFGHTYLSYNFGNTKIMTLIAYANLKTEDETS